MIETIATWLVTILGFYAAIGIVFALVFVSVGVSRIDPQAAGGTWGFRILIVPGAIAFWPLLARRWARGQQPPEERNPHRDRARGVDR